MIFTPGRCLKCAASFKTPEGISPHYTELQCSLDNGGVLSIGLCAGCEIDPSEFPEVVEQLRRFNSMNGGPPVDFQITGVVGMRTYKDVLYALQSGLCLGCHLPIGDTWVITTGMMMHEGCRLPPPAPIQGRVKGPVKIKA